MTRVGSWSLQIVYRPAAPDGFAGAFADSIIYGHRDLGDEGRAAISWKNLLASVSFSATGASGQLGFPSVRHAESFEDAGKIVGTPAVTQYERSRDGLRVLAYPQFSRRLPEQLFEAVVHVQLLEENLHQGRRPPERGGRGNRRPNGPRSNIPAPAFRGGVCRSRATSVMARARGGTRARRRRRTYGRFCLG